MAWRPMAAALAALLLVASPVRTQESPAWKPVSFAILEDYDAGDDLDEVRRDFALFQQLEVRTWRGSVGWDDYEPARGRVDLAWLQRFVALAAEEGIALRPYLAYTPEWAARRGGSDGEVWNDPPARLGEWSRFVTAVVRGLARHPHVRSYEIYNEENVRQWWDGDARQYASALTHASRAIRQHDRDAAVLLGGLVFPDVEWIEQVCATPGAAQAFSILPVHAYPETWTPADVTVENYLGGLEAFVRTADRVCGRKAIWINETGFATVPGRTEREQAWWWVRAVATFLATPRVEHIGIYEIKDLPPDRPVIGDAPNYHLGLTRVDRTPKLAFHTVDMLTDLLDVGRLAVDDAAVRVTVVEGAAGEMHQHLFRRPDGRRVLFVWDRLGGPAVHIDVPGATSLIEYDLDGTASAPQPAATLQRVPLVAGVPRVWLVM